MTLVLTSDGDLEVSVLPGYRPGGGTVLLDDVDPFTPWWLIVELYGRVEAVLLINSGEIIKNA